MKAEEGLYGQHKILTNAAGIMEFIFNFGPGYRLYFAEDGDTLIILLIGVDKSTQDRDIKKAIEYWNDHLSRKEEK